MKWKVWTRLSAGVIIASGLNGCIAFEVVKGVTAAVTTYWTYQIKNIDPINVTTISKECHLYEFVCLTQETKDSINLDDWDTIAYNNRVIVENCPNVEKPDCSDILALREKK